MNLSRKIIILLFSCLYMSCAPRFAVKKDFDFSAIKRVAVINFKGAGISGSMVADEFIKQLVGANVDVVEVELSPSTTQDYISKAKENGVDAFFTGTVSEFSPGQNFFVYKEDGVDGRRVVYSNPVIEVDSDMVRKRENITDDDSFLIYTNAAVAVNFRIIEAQRGSVVWADTFSYEGIDLNSSVEYSVRYLLNSLKKFWNNLK